MPNLLDATGLQVQTRAELVTFFTAQYQQIYGPDINLGSDTPDGQMMNIFIQSILDLEDLLMQVYNQFDPDNAVGNVLDQRVAINGIQRQAGTFTITPITLVVSQSINLYGLDQDVQTVYTVSDNAGNLWQLQNSQLGVLAGSHVFNFQAAAPGAALTVPNTITVPVTIVLGVTSVNNPTPYTTLGINEETDAVLKVRRQKSVSLASQGYLAGLLAALRNINGVTSAFVYENTSAITNSDGVPGHSIWVIVAGAGANADIAQAIYTKRNAGCGMFGSISFVITQIDGTPFTVFWDTVMVRNLFIFFQATSINGVVPPNVQAIRDGFPALFTPGVNEEVNINGVATIVQQIDPNTLVTQCLLSLGEYQNLILSGVPASGSFVIKYGGASSAAINWNDDAATIQSKLRAVAGLTTVVVTGSLASMEVDIDLSSLSDVAALLVITTNTLMTSAPLAISAGFTVIGATKLAPPTKRNQLVVTSPNIIIIPLVILPTTALVSPAANLQLSTYGGYGPYVYTVSVNNSGASINASTGLYTAGATPNVTDTVRVTDALLNTVTAAITVG